MRYMLWLILLVPFFLSANFIGMNNGARPLALGNAFVALSDDPDAMFFNPAGLARINQYSLKASHQNLYDISDLYNDMIAITFPTPLFRTGIALQKMYLVDVYSEQIIYISAAGIIHPKNIPIRFGASLKYESVNVKDYENVKNPKSYDSDIGIIIDISDKIFFGYSLKYLLEPKFKFISNSDKIYQKHTAGICYNWRSSVHFLADYVFTHNIYQWNVGSEIWFYDVFAARLGMYDEKLTIGFGLKSNYWSIDGATLSHTDLGSTYRISIGFNYDYKYEK